MAQTLNLHVWIRIYKAPEYWSNTDPDPQHWLQIQFRIWIILTDQNFYLIDLNEYCH